MLFIFWSTLICSFHSFFSPFRQQLLWYLTMELPLLTAPSQMQNHTCWHPPQKMKSKFNSYNISHPTPRYWDSPQLLLVNYLPYLQWINKPTFYFRCVFGRWMLTEMEILPVNGWDSHSRPRMLDSVIPCTLEASCHLCLLRHSRCHPGHRWEVSFTPNWALISISLCLFSSGFVLFI